jgi:hypothetical protein
MTQTLPVSEYLVQRRAEVADGIANAIARADAIAKGKTSFNLESAELAAAYRAVLESLKGIQDTNASASDDFEAGYQCACDLILAHLAGRLQYLQERQARGY